MTILIENQDSFFFATPASLLDLERDVASSWASKHIVPNKAIKWILGKYVEADNANSNGQYWSLKDLQMKRPTITYSPMNIGHRPENIVGTFVASDLIYPLGEDGAALQTNPYIEALGAYWKYYFPEQLVKIEEAYSTGSLFLSMECIGSSITCVNGENACGETFPYHGPMHDSYCEHILNRESSRQINDPHFLAGAIIMPPELPGWKGAQIKELSILEKTVPNLDKLYAEVAAEIPDADPKAWELSMQLLLLQARSSETKISASEIGRKIGSELVDASAEKRLYFKIEKGAKGCPISKPYGVVGEKSGMVHGCHDTMASAQKHLAAIYAATDPKSGYKPASKETQKNAETVKQHERRLAKEKAQEDTNNDSCPKCGADLSYCIDPNFCPNCGADLTEASLARDFNQEERKKLAKSGEALPDGSFPIVNEDDLRNAIRAIGRASNSSAAKAHIKKRAKALGLVNLIPDTWN